MPDPFSFDAIARVNGALSRVDDVVGRVERLDRAEEAIRDRNARALHDGILRLTHRLDQFEERRAACAKVDAEAEDAAIRTRLDRLPDPDESDIPARGHANTGDLSPSPPPPDPEPVNDAAEGDGDGEGDLPMSLTRRVPPAHGAFPSKQSLRYPEPFGPRPIAVSLNSEGDEDLTLGAAPPMGT